MATTNPIKYIPTTVPQKITRYHKKRKRIKAGSGEKMRKVGSKGAPTAKAFKDAKKTAKKFPL